MKNIFKNIILFIWTILCSLCLVELALSYIAPAPQIELINVSTSNEMQYQLVENPKLIYIPKPNTGPLNEQGHRGNNFSTLNKNTRWTIIGDSVVEGYGVETQDRFSEILKKDISYEIVNLGVRGYNLWQALEYFKLKNLQTNYLSVGISYNDLNLDSGEINEFNRQISKSKKSGLYAAYYSSKRNLTLKLIRFNLYRHALILFSKKNLDQTGNGLYGTNKIEEVLNEFTELSKSNNFKLSFIIFPINPNIYKDEDIKLIRKALTNQNVLDLDNISKEKFSVKERKTWFINNNDPCHLSPKGMQVLAQMILDYGKNVIF